MDPKKALKSSDRDSSRDENPGMDHFKMKKWAIFGVNWADDKKRNRYPYIPALDSVHIYNA